MMRLTYFRLPWFLFGVALAAVATGWALCAWRAAAVPAGPLGESPSPGGFLAVGAVGSADEAARPDPGENPEKESWERQLEQVERRRLITIAVFLSVVFLLLLFWWSWGKIHHRARKL